MWRKVIVALGTIAMLHTPTRNYLNERPFLAANIGQVFGGTQHAFGPAHQMRKSCLTVTAAAVVHINAPSPQLRSSPTEVAAPNPANLLALTNSLRDLVIAQDKLRDTIDLRFDQMLEIQILQHNIDNPNMTIDFGGIQEQARKNVEARKAATVTASASGSTEASSSETNWSTKFSTGSIYCDCRKQ